MSLGLKPLQGRRSPASPPSRTRRRWPQEFVRELRADVDALNSTNFDTGTICSACGSSRTSPDLQALCRLPAAGRARLCLTATIYLLPKRPRMAKIRDAYKAAHRQGPGAWPGCKDAEAQAQKIFDLEMKIAQAHTPRADVWRTCSRPTTLGRTDFARKAPGLDWTGLLQPPPAFVPAAAVHQQAPQGDGRRGRRWSASEPLAGLEGLPRLPSAGTIYSNVSLPKAFVDERFAFFGTGAFGHAAAVGAVEARRVNATNNALGEAVGGLLCRSSTSRRNPRRRSRPWSGKLIDGVPCTDRQCSTAGWLLATKAEAKRKLSHPERWAWATSTTGSTIQR